MITRVSRLARSTADLVFHDNTPGAQPTFSMQNITAGSTRFLQFWDHAGLTWSSIPVANAMAPLAGNATVFVASVNQAVLASQDTEDYVVVFRSGSIEEVEAWSFGSPETIMIEQLHQKLVPGRVEITRMDNFTVQQSFFDAKALGNEVLRFTYHQNTSGAQPEETQVNDSDLILV